MASVPGPFFSASGPQHLSEEARAAGFQVATPTTTVVQPLHHVNHCETQQLPQAYPITVTTAGQPAPSIPVQPGVQMQTAPPTSQLPTAAPSMQPLQASTMRRVAMQAAFQAASPQRQIAIPDGSSPQQIAKPGEALLQPSPVQPAARTLQAAAAAAPQHNIFPGQTLIQPSPIQPAASPQKAAPSPLMHPAAIQRAPAHTRSAVAKSATQTPASQSTINRRKRPLAKTSTKSTGVHLASRGGFTLAPCAVSPVTKPKYYSSASRATVKAQAEEEGHYKYRKVVGGKKDDKAVEISKESPQDFLDRLLKERGYSTQKYCSLEGGYYCRPTELQKASYGLAVVQAVRSSNTPLLKKMLQCGLSSNPCNNFGESVVHMVCRRGDYNLLKLLLEHKCSIQVTDDFGRTPLHDACWTAEPCFECVELILEQDMHLLSVVDCRGAPPLSYVKREHYKAWIDFFQSKKDIYWEPQNSDNTQVPPRLSQMAPHSKTIQDPPHAAPVDICRLISSGKLQPDDYLKQQQQQQDKTPTTTKQESPEKESSPVPVTC